MTQNIGYLLPDGECYTDELGCLILFYPDKTEYRRALFGALDYFGTWKAWEKDAEKRGQDAARAWKDANEITQGCLEMNTCETILELLTSIEFNTRQCCGETSYTTYQNNVVVTTTIIPGSGAAPGYWGEEVVTDWDDWREYVCGAAHSYVDDLIDTAEKLHVAATIGGYVLDFIAHLFSLVQWRMVEDIIPVNFSMIQTIIDGLGQGGIQNEFDTVADNIELGRADIVCALINGTSLEDAVEAAVDNTLIWDVFFTWFDYESTTAAIYNGEVDVDLYLPVIQSDICDCEITYTATDLDIWAISWLVTTTAGANNGLSAGDVKKITFTGSFPSDPDDIFKSGKYLQSQDHSIGYRYILKPDDVPAGWDDLAHDDIATYTGANWAESKDEQLCVLHSTGGTAGTIAFTGLKVFCDTGSGYEWFDGSLESIVASNTAAWSWDLVNNTFTADFGDGAFSDKYVKLQILALVPD